MACVVDYYSERFIAYSIIPISTKSLVYGSNSDGIQILNDKKAEHFAKKVGEVLNIKAHEVQLKNSNKKIEVYLPYSVQIHKINADYYLLNTACLLPPENVDTEDMAEAYSQLLRPEICMNFRSEEIVDNLRYCTWKYPEKCSECKEYIDEYEYYFYEKRSIDEKQTLLMRYICCVNCFSELLPTQTFQVPSNKLIKKVLPNHLRYDRIDCIIFF
jgi:hypothetical protein